MVSTEKITILNILYVPAIIVGVPTETISMIFILMILDTFIGILKNIRLYGGSCFSFKILGWGFITKLLILTIPFTLAVSGKTLGVNIESLVNSALAVMLLSETYSILGGIYSIKSKKVIKDIDFISIIIHNMRAGLEKFLLKDINKSNNNKK